MLCASSLLRASSIMAAGWRALLLVSCGVVGLVACEPAPPDTPDDEPEWFALATGKSCARAEVACGLGNCAANVDNDCKTAVTCQLRIECLCRTATGEEGPATGRSEDTIPGGSRGGIATHVVCNDGEVMQTLARTVTCR